MNRSANKSAESGGLAFAFLCGLGVPVVANNFAHMVGGTEDISHLLIGVLALVVAGALAAARTPNRARAAGWTVYGALPVGVIIDVVIDWNIRSYDRNLFPLEIVGWLIMAPFPIFMGISLGRDFGAQTGSDSGAKL